MGKCDLSVFLLLLLLLLFYLFSCSPKEGKFTGELEKIMK